MKSVRISGVMLDQQGYRPSHPVHKLDAAIMPNGELWEEFYGSPFEKISLNGDETLSVCGGTFIPDDGELARLSRDHGCKL